MRYYSWDRSNKKATFLFTATAVSVEADDPVASGKASGGVHPRRPYRLTRIGVGAGTRIDGQNVIITPETESKLGANLGLTGGLLLARHWPAPPLLLLKAAFGVVPIAANLYCFSLVIDRAKTTDEHRALALTRRIRLTGIGIPFAIAAFVIGIAYLH